MNVHVQKGFCVWFTGLSGAGKSTTAEALVAKLAARGISVTLLDGDAVRTEMSKGLGFSREDRMTNIRRVGLVAADIVSQGGTVVCALISPYRAAREECRALIGTSCFIEVFVDTPLGTCVARDPKGLYARARRGQLHHLTGIDDPYEPPLAPEIVLDTVDHTAAENAAAIVEHLATRERLQRPAQT